MGYDDDGPYYYSYAYPSALPADNMLAAPSDENRPTSNQLVPVVAYRPGCQSRTQTVPAEAGGTATVNVTRCY